MLKLPPHSARILTAAVYLSIGTGPLSIPARAEESGDRLDFKYMYYWDRNQVWNHTPAFDYFHKLSPDWSLQWDQEFDAVSGASRRLGADLTGKLGDHGVDATSGASQRKSNGTPFANPWNDPAFDAVSGASKSELRHSENPSVTYSQGGRVYTGGFYFSDEPDYRSYSPSLALAHDFNERNTTLGAVLAWFFDDFHPGGAFADQGGAKQIQSLSISATQVLSPLALASLTLNGIHASGYLGHPYNPVILADGYAIEENVPRRKTSLALAGELVQGYRIGGLLGSLRLNARRYIDTWGMDSKDAELQWYQYFGEGTYLRLRARGYRQSQSGFARDQYQGDELYRSADIRYYPFSSLLLGAKIAAPLFDSWHENAWLPDRFDLSYDFGIRDTYGDRGTSQPYRHYQLFPSTENYTEGTFMLGLSFDL